MAVPIQLTTNVQNETFGGVTYHIEGELVPALHLELSNTGVYFEHHILLWKDPAVMIALHPMKGAFKRMLAGMPFLLTGASGPGRIAFSRDGAGHVFGLHLSPGTSVDVREHQWLAATDNVDYKFTRVKGAANMLLGGTGFFIDTFSAPPTPTAARRARSARMRIAPSRRARTPEPERCCRGETLFRPAPLHKSTAVRLPVRQSRPPSHDGDLSGSRTREENQCPRSPSFTGEALAHREAGWAGNCTGPAKKRTVGRASSFLKFLSNDAALRQTRFARGEIQPLRQILRQPYGDCITHLLEV